MDSSFSARPGPLTSYYANMITLALPPTPQGFIFSTALALVAGSCIVNYCANMITAHGIGNGSTLVICTGIVTGG